MNLNHFYEHFVNIDIVEVKFHVSLFNYVNYVPTYTSYLQYVQFLDELRQIVINQEIVSLNKPNFQTQYFLLLIKKSKSHLFKIQQIIFKSTS